MIHFCPRSKSNQVFKFFGLIFKNGLEACNVTMASIKVQDLL